MAKIRKTPAGTYTTRVYVGCDSEGKQLFENVTRDTWHECDTAARQIKNDLDDKTYTKVQNEKFCDYAEKWLKLVEPEHKLSTIVSYKMYINTHFNPYFGNLKLQKISELLVRQYIADKLKSGLSSETVRKHFFVLSSILYSALKVKNPCRDIKPPKKSDYKPYIISDEEFALIHAAFKGTSDELPILLAAQCGMRIGEICALKWDDINKEEGTIRIDEALSITEDGYVENGPKSSRGKRTIVASEEILSLIEDRRTRQKEIKPNIFNIRPDGYSGRFGNLIDDHNKTLKDIKNGTEVAPRMTTGKYCIRHRSYNLQNKPLPDVRFHDLRHYHATTLYKHNVSDQYAADRLGHDILVLKKIYQHLQDETRKKEDEKVKNMYKKPGL